MTTETAAKKDIQKLQRAIIDGLEDVKAQDIQVFNTEALSPLFERVMVASGTSNRQTKALAASVRDAVRDAGFAKPRMEGEDNGEWIIVDCGAAVVHIMQPAIRQYYHLEDLWGEKPVRLKFGADKPAARASGKVAEEPKAGSLRRSSAAKKDIQKLQRAIIDGLEDVKAQDIQVFNTEALSPLFERVMVASGTSNRQTKALAASVRDAVRDAGFAKPRMEGEDNGEWIIVDCGAAVVHIMQPAIRQYYHLEDLWGEKPVRLKFGADKPAARASGKVAEEPKAGSLRRSSAAKKGVTEAFPSRAQAQKAAAKAAGKTPARKTAAGKPAAGKSAAAKSAPRKTAAKAPLKTIKVNAAKAPAKKAAGKTTAKPASRGAKAPSRKTSARKA